MNVVRHQTENGDFRESPHREKCDNLPFPLLGSQITGNLFTLKRKEVGEVSAR